MHITTLGLDLANTLFQVHGVDERGRVVLSRRVRRGQLVEVVASLPPCVIGMEACASAHHWGRTFEQLGPTVKLMSPKYVTPYVKTNKNDSRDAEAICEAVSRPQVFQNGRHLAAWLGLVPDRVRVGATPASVGTRNEAIAMGARS